jgi:hypothetical protein
MTNRTWGWVIGLLLVGGLLAIVGGYMLGIALAVFSLIGSVGVVVGLIVAVRRGYLSFWPWVIHFENRSREKPIRSDKLILYPGLNEIFVQVLAKVPVDYSLATVRIALKRRKRPSALLSYIRSYKKKENRYRNYPKTTLVNAFVRGESENPPPAFFVQLVSVYDRSPLREALNIKFIAERSMETGITWFLAYQPPYNLPVRSPIWLYLKVRVGSAPPPTLDYDQKRQALGIEFKSGVAGQRRPIFREIKLLSMPQSEDSKRDEL